MTKSTETMYAFGAFRLDATEKVLSQGAHHIPLAPKIIDTLVALVRHHGHVLEKSDLMKMVWPDTFVEEVNLAKNISVLRKVLQHQTQEVIETIPRRGYRFVMPVRTVSGTEETVPLVRAVTPDEMQPLGGVVPLGSPFYVERASDYEFRAALERREGLIWIEGEHQTGKSSLLARGLQQARDNNFSVAYTDLQVLSAANWQSAEAFWLTLAEVIADRLHWHEEPHLHWNPACCPALNFERYVRTQLSATETATFVWALDELERLWSSSFADEVLGVFRAWQNARSFESNSPWQQITIILSCAVTPQNAAFLQPPFGRKIALPAFTPHQIAKLNRLYASPLQNENELARFAYLVKGNPFLARQGLYALAQSGLPWAEFEQQGKCEKFLPVTPPLHLVQAKTGA